jgi:transposase
MVRTRRLFTKDFKLSAIAELEAGASVAEVARRHNLHPDLIYQWYKAYRAKGAAAFPDKRGSPGPQDPQAAKIAELERMIGRLTMENEFLKKALKRVDDVFVRKTSKPGTA